MKKIKSLFLALLAMMLAVPSLHAQGNYIIGAPVALEEVTDGMEVVFEGYSDDSNLGGYLGELKEGVSKSSKRPQYKSKLATLVKYT